MKIARIYGGRTTTTTQRNAATSRKAKARTSSRLQKGCQRVVPGASILNDKAKTNKVTENEAERILSDATLIEPKAQKKRPPQGLAPLLKKVEGMLKTALEDNDQRRFLEGNKPRKGKFDCYHFIIGRSLSRYPITDKRKRFYKVVEFENEKITVYMRDPLESKSKPTWIKDIYVELRKVITLIDSKFAANGDWSVQVNLSDDPNKLMKPHVDDKDMTHQYAIGLGDYTGGELATFREDATGKRTAVKLCIRNKVVKVDGRQWHVATKFKGVRFSIYFFKLWQRNCRTKTGILFPPRIMYSLKCRTDNSKKRSQRSYAKSRKKQKLEVAKQASAGHIDVEGFRKANGRKRSCMHDAIVNCAIQLGINISRAELKKTRDYYKGVNTSLAQLEQAQCVRENLTFEPLNFVSQKTHGAEFDIFARVNEGIFLLVTRIGNDDHALAYDSNARHGETQGVVICNQKTVKPRYLHPTDRRNPQTLRAAINTMYGEEDVQVRIQKVWRVTSNK